MSEEKLLSMDEGALRKLVSFSADVALQNGMWMAEGGSGIPLEETKREGFLASAQFVEERTMAAFS